MDGISYYMPGKGRTLYSGSLPNFRLRLLLRKLLLTLLLATGVMAGIRVAWIVGHNHALTHAKFELVYEPVVCVSGGLIWIQEPEETWRKNEIRIF